MQLILRIRKDRLGAFATIVLLLLPYCASATSPDASGMAIRGTAPSAEGSYARPPSRGLLTPRQVVRPTQEDLLTRNDESEAEASSYAPGRQASRASADRHGLKRALVDGGAASESGERKQLSKEERRALQRELREAARGANEFRPLQPPRTTD